MNLTNDQISMYLQCRFVQNGLTMIGGEASPKVQYHKPSKEKRDKLAGRLRSLTEESVGECCKDISTAGVLVSGGLDSSFIAMLANKVTQVKCFSTEFTDSVVSPDTKHVLDLADRLKLDLETIKIDTNKVKEILPAVIDSMQLPIADPTYVIRHLLAAKMKDQVDIILTGDAADEMFGGYAQYNFMGLLNMCDKVPFKNKLVPACLNKFFFLAKNKYPLAAATGKEAMVRRFKMALAFDDKAERYLSIIGSFDSKELLDLGFYANNSQHFSELNTPGVPIKQAAAIADFNQIIPHYYGLQWYMLEKKFGVKVKAPFLQQEIIDLAFSIPPKYKKDKFLLRIAAHGLPALIKWREKQPWQAPVNEWVKALELTSDSLPFFKKEYVEKALKGFEKNPIYYARQLWGMYVFEKWKEKQDEKDKEEPNEAEQQTNKEEEQNVIRT